MRRLRVQRRRSPSRPRSSMMSPKRNRARARNLRNLLRRRKLRRRRKAPNLPEKPQEEKEIQLRHQRYHLITMSSSKYMAKIFLRSMASMKTLRDSRLSLKPLRLSQMTRKRRLQSGKRRTRRGMRSKIRNIKTKDFSLMKMELEATKVQELKIQLIQSGL